MYSGIMMRIFIGDAFCEYTLIGFHPIFHRIIAIAIFPLLAQHTRSITPFLQQTADTLVSNSEEIFFWVGMCVY
jgi:hypothetical protein